MMIFKTERLHIRQLKMSDIESFHTLQSNPEVMKYADGVPMTYEQSHENLSHLISLYKLSNSYLLVWGITLLDTTFIGTCALLINDKKEYEIGYRLIEQYWANNYGKEVVFGFTTYVLNTLNIKVLNAYVAAQNIASVKILERYFTFEKEYWNKEEKCLERKYSIKKQMS